MKKLISLLLATVSLATFSACGVTDTPAFTETETVPVETTETEAAALTDGLPETDMDGFELRFYNYDDTYLTWSINQLTADEQSGDLINDAIYTRNRTIEDRFNASITETTVRAVQDTLTSVVLAGDDLYDIAMLYDETLNTHFANGELLSWNLLDYCDFEQPWWNQDAKDVFKLAGVQFAAVGDFSLSMNTRGFALLFNKEMYANYGGDSMYDIVLDGSWTYDALANISRNFVADLNGDSVFNESDQFGIVGALKLIHGSLVTGGGVKYIDTDADGYPFFAIDGNEYAISVMQKVYQIFAKETIYFNPVNDIHNGSAKSQIMFKNGQALFCGTSTKGIANYRDMSQEIGILPFPKYNEEQEKYYTLTSGGAAAVLPATINENRYDNIGIIIEALSFHSHFELLKIYQETVLKTKYSRDNESEAMLDIIFEGAFYDLGLSIWPSATYYVYMENIYHKNQDAAVSTTAAITDSVNATLEKFMQSLS
ncbi:MAG: hypothetical protein GX628_09495 [Clostridiales bacterium]|nr:hypothetical protein [Clostridiales bacterium]